MRADTKRGYRVEFYDGISFNANTGQWDLMEELRRQLYCIEYGIHDVDEFNMILESSSRHFITFGKSRLPMHAVPLSRHLSTNYNL